MRFLHALLRLSLLAAIAAWAAPSTRIRAEAAAPPADEQKDQGGAKNGDPKDAVKKDAVKKDAVKKDEDGTQDGKGDRKRPLRRAAAGKKGEEPRLERLLREHPEADKNKDGKISPEELREYTRDNPPIPEGRRLEALLKQHPEADKDKDGKLSAEEYREYIRNNPPVPVRALEAFLKRHPEADANKDGKLTREELLEYRKTHPDEAAGKAPPRRRPAEADKTNGGGAEKKPEKTPERV